MANGQRPRRGHLGFGIVLIALGILLLVMIRRPDFDPWNALWHYWPLILIFIGLGQLFDRMRRRNNPEAGGEWISGTTIALVILVVLFGFLARSRNPFHFTDHISGSGNVLNSVQKVENQGAEQVTTKINMPAGQLTIGGGSNQLLEADFNYSENMEKPEVNYTSSGTSGRLEISQRDAGGIHIGPTRDDWNLKFGNTPMELEIDMGAGQGDLNLQQLELSRLRIDMGAGEITVDLTGDRKRNLTADIHGGVGSATIRLPKNVGVQVHAEGGIGTIDTQGLRHEGGMYLNDAYGKSPVTIHMNIEGGVGEIRLIQE